MREWERVEEKVGEIKETIREKHRKERQKCVRYEEEKERRENYKTWVKEKGENGKSLRKIEREI